MFLCFYRASVYLAAVELKCSVLCSSSFWLGIHLFLAPHLECIALALLLFLSCINNFSLYLIIIAMCNFSHLKKKKSPLHSSHHISFASLYLKIPGKNCLCTFYFQCFFCLNLLQSGFYVHCFRKTALVKVTDDLHVAKSSCQFSVLV